MFRLSYKILLFFTIFSALGGIITLIPRSAASYPNIINYFSLCPFTPAAAFYCFFLAGLSCFIRSTFIKDQDGKTSDKLKKHGKSFFILVPLLIIAIFFNYRYIEIKTYYTDSSTSASVLE